MTWMLDFDLNSQQGFCRKLGKCLLASTLDTRHRCGCEWDFVDDRGRDGNFKRSSECPRKRFWGWFGVEKLRNYSQSISVARNGIYRMTERLLTERPSIGCIQMIQWSCWHMLVPVDCNRNIVYCHSATQFHVKSLDFYHLVSFALPPFWAATIIWFDSNEMLFVNWFVFKCVRQKHRFPVSAFNSPSHRNASLQIALCKRFTRAFYLFFYIFSFVFPFLLFDLN